MTHAEGIILDEELELVPPEEGCSSCAKVGLFSPRGDPKEVGKDSTLCGWCRVFERTYGREVPRQLLLKRAEGRRISERDIVQSLRRREP